MPFKKYRGFVKKKNYLVSEIIYILRKRNAKWYGAEWCGYCKLLKSSLNNIDKEFNKFIVMDEKNIPKSINGFPCLYFPKQNDKKEILVPGFRTPKNIFKLIKEIDKKY